MGAINPIRKILVKMHLLKGMDAKNAMIQAGYSPNTASKSTANKVVKVSQDEIIQELKAKDYTVDVLINKTEKAIEKANSKADISNIHRGIENIAKFVGIDKGEAHITNVYNISKNEVIDADGLTALARRRNKEGKKV